MTRRFNSDVADKTAAAIGGPVRDAYRNAGGGVAGYEAVCAMDVDEFSKVGRAVQKFCTAPLWTYESTPAPAVPSNDQMAAADAEHQDDDHPSGWGLFAD